jgi:peptidoglycan/LPS O-acetylase OafA/YrhL
MQERPGSDALLDAFRRTRHFGSLDGLRCLAILPVIWHHSTPRPLPGVLGKGPLGVELFFAISGFLITTLLLRERSRHGTIDLRRFYVRRSLRIFPVYYAVLLGFLLFVALVAEHGTERDQFFQNLPYFATYTSNWFVDHHGPHAIIFVFAWSLATEEQFYLTWPWALRFTRGWLLPVLVMLLVLSLDLGAEGGWFLPVLPPGSLERRMLGSIAAPICLGSLAAVACHQARGYRILSWVFGWRASSLLCLLLLAWLVARDGSSLLLVHAALAALVVACCLRDDHWLAPLLRWAPLVHVGRVSYGMYLMHVPVIGAAKLLFPVETHTVPLFVVSAAFTVFVATLSYRFLETPILRFKERFRAI